MNGKVDFYRTWNEYRAGFGNLSEEFWLGTFVTSFILFSQVVFVSKSA